MKKLVLSLSFVLLWSASIEAQSTYVITLGTSAQQDTILEEIIRVENEQTCVNFGLTVTCTQPNVCAAARPVISPCDAPTARARGGRIWGTTVNADRVEFFQFGRLTRSLQSDRREAPAWHQSRARIDWATGVITPAEKNAACTALRRPVPCNLFDQ